MIDKSTFSDRKALFHTFGCKLNFAETSTVAKMLAGRGIISAREGETPDIIVVNTCSVTELADKKCRQAIRAFNRRYPAAAIVVTGCYAQLKAPDIEKMPGVVIVAGNDRKLDNRAGSRPGGFAFTALRSAARPSALRVQNAAFNGGAAACGGRPRGGGGLFGAVRCAKNELRRGLL